MWSERFWADVFANQLDTIAVQLLLQVHTASGNMVRKVKGGLCLLLSLLCASLCVQLCTVSAVSEKSPYYQHLPDCSKTKPADFPVKKTKAKGIVCPMIKDEEGFLSEWVAYYQVQGFDQVIFYDNNSTSKFTELAPWVKSGFVQIRREWWIDANNEYLHRPAARGSKHKYKDMMHVKLLAEMDCKQTAVDMGIEIFVSVDMDEYITPTDNKWTVMDELDRWFTDTTRGVAIIPKYQFPPTPHILEPIHLLTIEAYQTRNTHEDKMNYYSSVSRKVALKLTGQPDYNANTTKMMIHCCDFHGCGNYKFYKGCPDLIFAETGNIIGKHRKWMNTPHMHHYARSLEKYVLKQQTWETASAENSEGYDIYNFFNRLTGWEYDDSAVFWGCAVRAKLAEMTGEVNYVRPGDSWYRNPEYGKAVEDPKKRGRNGAGYGKKLGPREMNPYPIFDTYQNAHKTYVDPARRVRGRRLASSNANNDDDMDDDGEEGEEDDDFDADDDSARPREDREGKAGREGAMPRPRRAPASSRAETSQKSSLLRSGAFDDDDDDNSHAQELRRRRLSHDDGGTDDTADSGVEPGDDDDDDEVTSSGDAEDDDDFENDDSHAQELRRRRLRSVVADDDVERLKGGLTVPFEDDDAEDDAYEEDDIEDDDLGGDGAVDTGTNTDTGIGSEQNHRVPLTEQEEQNAHDELRRRLRLLRSRG